MDGPEGFGEVEVEVVVEGLEQAGVEAAVLVGEELALGGEVLDVVDEGVELGVVAVVPGVMRTSTMSRSPRWSSPGLRRPLKMRDSTMGRMETWPTNMPCPWRTSTMSRATRVRTASRTEERDTPRSVHSWDSVGNASPICRPERRM